MKNNIGDRYFAPNRITVIFRYLSIVFIILGLIILFFAYGFGIMGIPIVILGGILYFCCSSMIVNDKEYDRHINDMLKTLDDDDELNNAYIKKWEFSTYGLGTQCKRGGDAIYRTDQYVCTRVYIDKTTLTIYRYDISVSGKIERYEFKSILNDTQANCITKTNDLTSYSYIEVTSEQQDIFDFPVPYNNYDVEELLNFLTN